LHRDVHALARFRGVGVAGIAGEEYPGVTLVVVNVDIVELIGHAVAHLVDAVPGDVLDVERIGAQDFIRLGDDLFDRRLAHLRTRPFAHIPEVDVHPGKVAAFARDVQDVPGLGVDRALGAPVGEVRIDEDVHHAPRVHRDPADVLTADRSSHPGVGAVAADDVLGVHGELLTLVVSGAAAQADLDGVDPAIVVNREVDVFNTVLRGDPAGPEIGGLSEVVEYAGLVDDEVGEFADVIGVIDGAFGTNDVLRVLRVRVPEIHVPDVVGLGGDVFGEPEGLEGLDAAGLDPVGLAELEAAGAALNDPCRQAGVVGHLSGEQHAGGPRPDDQHIDFAREVVGALETGSRRGLFARLFRYVPVMVKLHCSIPFLGRLRRGPVARCSLYEHEIPLSNRSYMMAETGATKTPTPRRSPWLPHRRRQQG